jgi:hypothetical protein
MVIGKGTASAVPLQANKNAGFSPEGLAPKEFCFWVAQRVTAAVKPLF